MNTKYIALGAIVMILLASCTPKEESTNNSDTAQQGTVESEVPAASSSEGPKSYSEYNGEDLSNIGEQTVLFFHQKSCGTCVKTDKDLMSQSELPNNLKVVKVDFDTETELNKKYGVTTKHTFVLIDAQGNMIAKEMGLATANEIVEFANNGEMAQVKEETADAPILAASSKGEYKDYNGTVPGDSVLFFHAKWCPSCVGADKNFSAENELAINADIIKVDYDDSTELKSKYGVTSQHTFVRVDSDGNLVKKMAGGNKSSDLTALFN